MGVHINDLEVRFFLSPTKEVVLASTYLFEELGKLYIAVDLEAK